MFKFRKTICICISIIASPNLSFAMDDKDVFTKRTVSMSKSSTHPEQYSIPTTSSADDISTPEDDIILAPKPKVVQKQLPGSRQAQHAAAFEETTGHLSARKYLDGLDEELEGLAIPKPQIGHAQGYQNHGQAADWAKDNLVVISQPANLQMNYADNQYEDGHVDHNRYVVAAEGPLVGKYAIQQIAHQSHPGHPITPPIVIKGDLASTTPEQKAALKQKVERAFDPDRIKEMKELQNAYPGKFATTEEYNKKVLRKLKQKEQNGEDTSSSALKFKDQSRTTRKELQKELDKKKKAKEKKSGKKK